MAIRVFISGKISGLERAEVEGKFARAEGFLHEQGFVPVSPLKTGLSREHSWRQHMKESIDLLLSCGAIYMLEDWKESRGARIEHNIASGADLSVMFAASTGRDEAIVLRVSEAIKDVTALELSDYDGPSRRRELVFARMIFICQCKRLGMNSRSIARYINRAPSVVAAALQNYRNDLRFNGYFRSIALGVEELIDRVL